MRLTEALQILPLLFFIAWGSGLVHSGLGLITPMVYFSLASALSIMLFFALDRSGEVRALSVPAFIIALFLANPIPYVFILMAGVYLIRRETSVLAGLFVLMPAALAEGLGLPSAVPITLDLPLAGAVTLPFGLPIVLSFVFAGMSLLPGFVGDQSARLRSVTRSALYFSAILLFLSLSSLDPLGAAKDGVVACDGYHHSLDSAFFENDTMTHSTLRYLDSVGYRTRVIDEPFTPESLEDVSVLMIETPEDPLSPSEVEALDDFVKNGGGLFVLGDHTNIMNCYTNLLPVLSRFGLHLNFDYSMPMSEPHFASLAGFDSTEVTAGATLSLNSSDALILYSLRYTTWADPGDWSAPERAYMAARTAPDAGEPRGVLPICAASNYGRGRVVAISNSDSLAGANLPYNYRFISRVVGYLDTENSPLRSPWTRMLLLLLLTFGVLRARFASVRPLILSACIVLVLVGAEAALWQAPEPGNRIALDVGHGNIEGYNRPDQYRNIFLVIFAQHFGFNPVLVDGVPDDLGSYRAYVTMGPTRPFSEDEADRIEGYVESGGNLIVFDGYHQEMPSDPSISAANSLIQRFGMRCNGSLLGDVGYFNNTTWGFPLPYRVEATIEAEMENDNLRSGIDRSITMYSAVEVEGGKPIARYDETPVMAASDRGQGRVIVIGDHTIFRNFVSYEPVFSYPDPELKKLIENIFAAIGGREENGA